MSGIQSTSHHVGDTVVVATSQKSDCSNAAVPIPSSKPARVVSFCEPGEQPKNQVRKEVRFELEAPGEAVFARQSPSSSGLRERLYSGSSQEATAERDEQSTRRSEGDGSRESPSPTPTSPKATVVRQRKRRASDSFDIEDSGNCLDDTAELVRVSKPSLTEPAETETKPQEDTADESREPPSHQESGDEPEKPARNASNSSLEVPLVKPEILLRVDEVDEDVPLTRLENVTAQSRSLIPQELLYPRSKRTIPTGLLKKKKMTSTVTSSSNGRMPAKSKSARFRSRLNLSKKKQPENRDDAQDPNADSAVPPATKPSGNDTKVMKPKRANSERRSSEENVERSRRSARPVSPTDDDLQRAKPQHVPPVTSAGSEETPMRSNRSGRTGRSNSPQPKEGGRGIVERIRSASRSRSLSRSRKSDEAALEDGKSIMIAVTSCRSDAYHNQKAPGSTSKLPRKAPSNLKLFHELAVGVKDAYTASGETPVRPDPEEQVEAHESRRDCCTHCSVGILGKSRLCKNICACWQKSFRVFCSLLACYSLYLFQLLALVDEVAMDTATRGALKDDTTFKCLRDVIKKCNKVLETMLIRRERKYTLFFRVVQPHDAKDIERIQAWNLKVEKAVGAVADGRRSRRSG